MRLLSAFFFAALSCLAQQGTVRLRLDTAGTRTEFHIGQAIPVRLTFETDGNQPSSVLTVVRPRRIRPQAPDEFSAEPATGWVDPLGDLTWTMDNGDNPFFGQAQATLDAGHPVAVERSLNEFIVFRKPGHYVIHCKSRRLTKGSGAPVESNALELDILPRDEAEAARQFASARAILETGKPPRTPERVFFADKEKAQSDAVETLRCLDTEAAAVYLASIYGPWRRTDAEIEYALLASEHREAIVRELERRMADPELSIIQSYLITLDQLKAHLQESQTGHPLTQADQVALYEAIDKRVFELVASKTPQAKADTYYYLFETGSKSFRNTPGMLRLVVESMQFASPFEVEVLLSSNWGELKSLGATLIPVLKEAVTRSWPPMSPNVAGVALLRLAELDPKSADELARNALLSGEFSIGDAQILEFSIPASAALDQALLSQFRQRKPVEARIARFASPAIKDELWRAYDARVASLGKPECPTALVAYFFRVDPVVAAKRVADSRASGTAACMALQYPGLEHQLMSPGLEGQLIEDAKSSDRNLWAEYRTMSMGASPAALPALLQALDQATGPKQEIIPAILQGRRWVLKEADYKVLEKNCAGTSACPEIARMERESAAPYGLRLFDSFGHEGVWLSNHEVDSLADLDERLTQYPAGATFRWQPAGATMSGAESATRDRVQKLLVRHGMTLLQ